MKSCFLLGQAEETEASSASCGVWTNPRCSKSSFREARPFWSGPGVNGSRLKVEEKLSATIARDSEPARLTAVGTSSAVGHSCPPGGRHRGAEALSASQVSVTEVHVHKVRASQVGTGEVGDPHVRAR